MSKYGHASHGSMTLPGSDTPTRWATTPIKHIGMVLPRDNTKYSVDLGNPDRAPVE